MQSTAGPFRISQKERRVEALEYRKAGLTYEQIGAQMGTTRQNAHHLVKAALAQLVREPAEDVRTLEMTRLDKLQASLWPQALKGNQGAVDRILRILERRAKLLGLDAPVRSDVTSGGEPLRHIIEVEIGRRADDPAQSTP